MLTGCWYCCDVAIRLDAEGRYCLNDLHKAAGGEKKHQPTNFMRKASTESLRLELNAEMYQSSESRSAPAVNYVGGVAPGTYAVRELVYAYAMWISPAFHLKVIRAYDTMQTQGVAVAEHAAVIGDTFGADNPSKRHL